MKPCILNTGKRKRQDSREGRNILMFLKLSLSLSQIMDFNERALYQKKEANLLYYQVLGQLSIMTRKGKECKCLKHPFLQNERKNLMGSRQLRSACHGAGLCPSGSHGPARLPRVQPKPVHPGLGGRDPDLGRPWPWGPAGGKFFILLTRGVVLSL